MTATLQLNLSDSLTADELQELTAIAVEEEQSLEKVLFDAAQERVRRRREIRSKSPTPKAA